MQASDVAPHIYCVTDNPRPNQNPTEIKPDDNTPDLGWYFVDECEQLNGPFPTKEECEASYKRYCSCL